MAGIILPSRFSRQPQYAAQLNRAHKLSGIKFAYSAGRGPHDGVHGLGSVTGTLTYGNGPKGRNIQPADSTSYLGFADCEDYNVLGDITVIVLVTIGGTTVQQGILTKCETTGGANTPFGLFTEVGGAVSFNRANSGFRVWASAQTLSAGTYVLAVTQVADISVAPKFYINGVLDSGAPSSLYSGTGAGAPTSNTTPIKIGNRGTDLATQFYGTLSDACVIGGVISASDVANFNFPDIWKAPPRKLFAVPAASGSGVGSAPGIAAVSGTGASLSSQPGSIAGIAAVSGVGASLFAGVGAAPGIAAASGVGASNSAGVGSSNGIAAASGVGTSIAAGSAIGAASGIASVSGVGASIAASTGTSAAAASASGVSSFTGTADQAFSGGYLYRSKEERDAYTRKQRIALGIIEEEKPVELVKYDEILKPRKQKKVDREAQLKAEIKYYLDLELQREEEAIVRMLMEM